MPSILFQFISWPIVLQFEHYKKGRELLLKVTNDVPANSTVVGVPAKIIREKEPGWHLG